MKNTKTRLFHGTLLTLLALLLGTGLVTTAQAATQVIAGDPIRISVADNGMPAISVKHPTTGVYTIQYYKNIDAPSADWGSVIWLAGTDTNYRYLLNSYGIITGGLPPTPVSNTTTVDGATSTITTVLDLGSSGIQLTQRFIYTEGDRFVSKEWSLANTGATTYNDLRFFHGGDTYFGNVDAAYSFYAAANSMVYLRNNNYTEWGIMGFYANPATPASHYFSGSFSLGLTQAGTNALLNDTVDASYQDAGYQLQWNRASLAPGETWTILASEVWSLPGAVQVIAPVGQNVAAGATAEISFTVQNLAATSANVSFSASDTAGWGTAIQGDTTATIAANGNISVPVRVSVAGGATAGQTSSVTLTVDDGVTTTTVSALLTVVSVDLSISSDPLVFGTVTAGNSSSQTVTITNSGATALKFGDIGGGNPLWAPFSKTSDTCSGATVEASATCSFDIAFTPGHIYNGEYYESLYIPILEPIIVSRTLTISGTGIVPHQLIEGNPIRISVSDYGIPAISVKDPTTGEYIAQYFDDIDAPNADWGSVIWLAGNDDTYEYAMHSSNYGGTITPVSNTTTVVGATSTITTVVDLGDTGIRVTQKFIYTEGDRFVSKEWHLTNTGGTTYNDLRFFHGGDTIFGGEDQAYSFYDAANSMVYLRNLDYTNWGIMGFYANPATPASHYFSGRYYLGLEQAGTSALLNDTVDGSYRDAGYQLQWNRASLAPGDTWTILASEVWSLSGAIQVIAPVGQNVSAGGTAELSFTVQNLAADPVNVTLSASDTAGWGAAIQGSTTVTIAANGNISVPVRVSVAGGATAGQTSSVTLTADDGIAAKSVSALLTVVSVKLSLSSDPVAFGTITTGSSSSQTVTITNSGATAVKFGDIGVSNPLATPFSKTSDTCSGATVAASATCSFDIAFNPSSNGVYNDSLDIPILDPLIVSRTLTVSGTGSTLPAVPKGPHIVWRNASTGQNSVWTMDGTTFKSSAFINSAPAPWKVVGIGDLDNDGSPDIIWRNPSTGQNSVWFMDRAAFKSNSSLTTVATAWSVVGVGDLNGDGKADIIWRNPTTGQNSAWIMNGASISSSAYLSSAPAPWTVVGVGDLNADNKADLIWRNPTTGQNSAWLMNGTTISSSVYLTSAPAAWTVVGVGDLNADNKADIIWRNATTGQNSLWLMNGTTVSSSVYLTSAAAPATVVGVADFNNDNKADILWRNPTTGQDTLWLMNGATTSSTVTLGSAPVAWSIIGVLKMPGDV